MTRPRWRRSTTPRRSLKRISNQTRTSHRTTSQKTKAVKVSNQTLRMLQAIQTVRAVKKRRVLRKFLLRKDRRPTLIRPVR